MGVNPKPYMRMTPEQSREAMKNIMRLHRNIAIAALIGQAGLAAVFAVCALSAVTGFWL